jgi:alpha-beta hydrolase superfamily lysophospholipase
MGAPIWVPISRRGVSYKALVMLAEGTHTIIMEKNRMQLFQAVQGFLDEAGGS